MIVRVCAFTERGAKLAERVAALLPDDLVEIRGRAVPLAEWTRESFELAAPSVFIGACGIAVRAIAPLLRDKLTDPPVMVIDEAARFVIPLTSGHYGGGIELAARLARALGAESVVTTATDVNGLFAVDVFAKKNALHICNREGIAAVSAKVLAGERITVSVDPRVGLADRNAPDCVALVPFPPASGAKVDVAITPEPERVGSAALLLAPKEYAVGVGCKRGKSAAELDAAADAARLTDCAPRFWDRVCALATVDVKRKERGLLAFAQRRGLPLDVYSAAELNAVPGAFSCSEFVRETVGADCVCERAAALRAGGGYELVLRKTAVDGVTFAVAKRTEGMEITTWET